jgi:hypothetical protein
MACTGTSVWWYILHEVKLVPRKFKYAIWYRYLELDHYWNIVEAGI